MPVEIFSGTESWTSLLVALIGGGGVGTIIGAVSSRRKDTADIAAQACDILTDSVINPLREQVDEQEGQIEHLESSSASTSRSRRTPVRFSTGCRSSARSSIPTFLSGIRNRICRTNCVPTSRRRPSPGDNHSKAISSEVAFAISKEAIMAEHANENKPPTKPPIICPA